MNWIINIFGEQRNASALKGLVKKEGFEIFKVNARLNEIRRKVMIEIKN